MKQYRYCSGQFNYVLPDKEFRSDIVTSTCVDGLVISANLCMSPCSTDYIFTCDITGAWRVVSEDSKNLDGFLRFIVSAIPAISMMPSEFRCFLSPINSSTRANFSKSSRLAVLS